ncbi:MAG: divergent PAP2 family protein [Clostridia bacterium]|nr:divergent PAP2 family protein [Clostridia bacterium]
MDVLVRFMANTPLVAAITGWAAAQVLKVLIESVMSKKFIWESIFASGGMPSSHSAFVTALATVIGFEYGLGSVYFSLAAAFAMVVMYDACGVRRAVGEQAKALNRIIHALKEDSTIGQEKALKEILGHSPFQVVMGFFLGLLIGILMSVTF